MEAAIRQVFDGMRHADSARIRTVFAADVRFALIDAREGAPTIRVQDVEGWLEAVDGSAGRWDERIHDIEIRIDGPLASAWVPYTFYLDGAISHCGVNSMELLRDADGWKVTQISDTRRREGCH